MAGRRQPQPHAASSRFANVENCFSRVPLSPGEGGAKRRVRARMLKHWAFLPSSGPSGHLLPEGEGLSRGFPRLFWTVLISLLAVPIERRQFLLQHSLSLFFREVLNLWFAAG